MNPSDHHQYPYPLLRNRHIHRRQPVQARLTLLNPLLLDQLLPLSIVKLIHQLYSPLTDPGDRRDFPHRLRFAE